MTVDEESRLIKSAARGDSGAFEKLVLEHQKQVYNLALKLTGSPEDALDASQDAFLKAYQNLDSFRGESRLSVWLYRLTYNASMDIIKKNRRGVVIPLPTDDVGAEMDVPDTGPTPTEQTERRELQIEVRQALRELPPDKRQILLMREFSGLSYTAIARELGIEEGTVKSRLSRARISLAEILKKRGTFS